MTHPFLRKSTTVYKHRLVLGALLRMLGFAMVIQLTVPHLTDWSAQTLFLFLAGMIICGLAFIWHRTANHPSLPSTFLRHIHHRLPEAEYSLHLFLLPDEELSPLQKLQKERIASVLSQKDIRKVVPYTPYIEGFMVFVLSLCLGILFSVLLTHSADNHPMLTLDEVHSSTPVEALLIQPPAYTDRPEYIWQEKTDILRGSELRFANHSPFEYLDGDQTRVSQGLELQRTVFIRPVTHDSGLTAAPWRQLRSKEDALPAFTLLQPEQEQLVMDIRQTSVLPVLVEVKDDFGIKSVDVHLTIARGRGEGVRFSEQRISLHSSTHKNDTLLTISYSLELKALNMNPGDECYVQFVAKDYRPDAPEARSSRLMVIIQDTTEQISTALVKLGVPNMPEYFRSQRQIIIDIQHLLADRTITRRSFERKAQDLALDQKILRLRYGQFLGEEFESAMESLGEGHDDHEHDHNEHHKHAHETVLDAEGEQSLAMQSLPEGAVHKHDDAETNTFFQPEIKQKLKQSLANMWESELHLRLFEPAKALPFAYKALELLKEVQQADRLITRKIQFVPSPIVETDVRFKGERKDIVETKKQSKTSAKQEEYEAEHWLRRLDDAQLLTVEERNQLRRVVAGFSRNAAEALSLLDTSGSWTSSERNTMRLYLMAELPLPFPASANRTEAVW